METIIYYKPEEQVLFNNRIIHVSGPVDSNLSDFVTKSLLALDKLDPSKPIIMFINSPGGEITSGFSIYDCAQFIQAPVVTVVAGMAASMGSIISLCAPKDKRFAFPNSKILIHQPLISGTMTGPASDIEIHAEDIIKTKNRINELYSKETGKSLDIIAKATDRDNWMTAQEALEFGLIAKIIKKKEEIFH